MIRKFATIDAPVDLVSELFCDVAQWHLWMPGVRSVQVLEESEGLIVVAVTQEYLGRRAGQVMECRRRHHGMSQHQRSGWLRRWDAEWSFFQPPDGRGTTVSCELEAELGLLGLFSPKRTLQRLIDRLFAEMIESARQRARALMTERQALELGRREGQVLLQVFETASGLEVIVAGRRYLLAAAE